MGKSVPRRAYRDLLVRARAKVFSYDRRLLARSMVRLTRPRQDLVRLGTVYGGWWVPSSLVDHDSTVYSVGVGEDTSFDEEVHRRFGCWVYGIDPTPRSETHVAARRPPGFTLVPIALWVEKGHLRLFMPANAAHVSLSIDDRGSTHESVMVDCATLTDIRQTLGHSCVDLLKMDIEGAEAEVLEWLIRSGERPTVLAVECEKREPWWRTRSRLQRLMACGYDHVHAEGPNHLLVRSSGSEFWG